MRISNTHQIFFGVICFYIFMVLLTGLARADVNLAHKVAQIYPKLNQSKASAESRAEAVKLILYEMGYGYEHHESLLVFYSQRDYEPLWVTQKGLTKKALKIVELLDKSWTHGFNPENYDLDQIRGMSSGKKWQENAIQSAILELGISNAVSRFVKDMTSIRVAPKKAHIDESHWRDPADPAKILKALTEKAGVQEVIKSLYPDNALYTELRLALIDHVLEIESLSGGGDDINPPDLNTLLIKPGDRHSIIPRIRARLMNETGIKNGSRSLSYDSHLNHLVKNFQTRHNIRADGVIGPETLRLLHKDSKARLYQIIANMERLRWIDFNRPDKYIVVNVPSARLWAIKNQRVIEQMPVVVGRPDRPTQSFVASIKGVRLNPNWTIPQKIKTEDIYADIQKNPKILIDKNIDIYNGFGIKADRVNPASVNWKSLSKRDIRRFNMVQKPGNSNPLGRFRFLMFNKNNIYIHDTNQPELFHQSYRAQSSGCIRAAQPEALADFVMDDFEDWSKISEKTLSENLERDFSISKEIPVYILYLTMWTSRDGSLTWGPDIYGYDSQLIESLRHKNAIFIPDNPSSWVTSLSILQNKG